MAIRFFRRGVGADCGVPVRADPTDADVVWVNNERFFKSVDGGVNWEIVPTPHGDNHDLWINPKDNRRMINANDGGANISNNKGASWSTQQNQPTAQFYRVITDNLFPYHVYGGQQDNSAIAILSRTNDGGIDWKDWYSVAGCESAYLAFDPDDPKIVFGGCYQGIIEKWVKATREGKPIKEYPELSLGNAPEDFKYRYNWNAPIIADPHDPSVIYHAGNVVFRSGDAGQSWEVISPDLTTNDPAKQNQEDSGGLSMDNSGAENHTTIFTIAESPLDENIIWVGTDDGNVQVTRDGGKTWTNTVANISGLPANTWVYHIEASVHDKGTAYAVFDGQEIQVRFFENEEGVVFGK